MYTILYNTIQYKAMSSSSAQTYKLMYPINSASHCPKKLRLIIKSRIKTVKATKTKLPSEWNELQFCSGCDATDRFVFKFNTRLCHVACVPLQAISQA